MTPLVHIPLAFWQSTSTCLLKRQYTGNYYINKGYRYPSVHRKLSMSDSERFGSLHQAIGDGHIALMDFRSPWRKLIGGKLTDALANTGILNQCPSQQLRKMVTRVFLNPTPDIQDYLIRFKTEHYGNRTVFGVQARLGGCLANSREKMQLMSINQFKALPEKIRFNLHGLVNPVVYLSTDSDFAETYIREKLPDIEILTSSAFFTRHHSTGITEVSTVKSSLVDLFLLADSDILLISDSSKFGRMADFMTRAKKVIRIKYTRKLVNVKTCDRYISSLHF